MNVDLARLVAEQRGVLHRTDVLARAPHHVLDRALAGGQLVRVLPQVYVTPENVDDLGLVRAVARYAEGRGLISHPTALWLWGLLDAPGRPMHLTVGPRSRLRATPLLRVHRDYGDPPGRSPRIRHGLATTTLERALLQSWPILEPDGARAVLIRAVRERRSTADRLASELTRLPRVAGRSELVELIGLLASGCHSELELFGFRRVFTGAAFAQLQSQHQVRVGGRTVYLDRAAEDVRVGVELDGAAYHDGTLGRDRDRRRDVLLAANGWVILRFGYRRLVEDSEAVRREVATVLAVRRDQLRRG